MGSYNIEICSNWLSSGGSGSKCEQNSMQQGVNKFACWLIYIYLITHPPPEKKQVWPFAADWRSSRWPWALTPSFTLTSVCASHRKWRWDMWKQINYILSIHVQMIKWSTIIPSRLDKLCVQWFLSAHPCCTELLFFSPISLPTVLTERGHFSVTSLIIKAIVLTENSGHSNAWKSRGTPRMECQLTCAQCRSPTLGRMI